MKTFVALAAAVTLLAGIGEAIASGLLGPPEPEARVDHLALSAGYERDATKWKPGDAGFGDVSVTRNQAYVQILDTGIAFTERGAGFLRAGAADFDDGADFQDGYKPFVSTGMKDVWHGERRSRFKVGTIFLASYYPGYEAEKALASGRPSRRRSGTRGTSCWESRFRRPSGRRCRCMRVPCSSTGAPR